MNTTNRGQENRYLESPYVIRGTGPQEQTSFSIKNPIEGGSIFSKRGFLVKPLESGRIEKDNADTEDKLIEEGGLTINQFSLY